MSRQRRLAGTIRADDGDVFAFAEGERTRSSEKLDEFGHARLSGVAEAIAGVVEEAIGKRCRYDRLGNLHRCFSYAASASRRSANCPRRRSTAVSSALAARYCS